MVKLQQGFMWPLQAREGDLSWYLNVYLVLLYSRYDTLTILFDN